MEGQRSRWLGEGPYFLTHLPWTQEYLNEIHGFNTALLHSHTCTEATDDIKMSHLDPFFYYVPVVIGMLWSAFDVGNYWSFLEGSFQSLISLVHICSPAAPDHFPVQSIFTCMAHWCPPRITYGRFVSSTPAHAITVLYLKLFYLYFLYLKPIYLHWNV